MSKKLRALSIPQIRTLEEADAHQRKHGFAPIISAREKQLAALHTEVDLNKRKGATLRGTPRKMNATEREFSHLLEARKRTEKIQDWKFEGVRLGWGDCMVFKPDFTEVWRSGRMCLIEVKGPFIRDRDIVRFKGCKAEWKKWFDFQFWQRDRNKQWNRLL